MLKRLCIDDAENMCRGAGTAAALHVVVLVYRIKRSVIYTLSQFNRLNNSVLLAIDEVNRIVTPVGYDQVIRLRQIDHHEGLPEALNAVKPLSRPEVEHLDCLMFLSREK